VGGRVGGGVGGVGEYVVVLASSIPSGREGKPK
jgi:hypothetical protein